MGRKRRGPIRDRRPPLVLSLTPMIDVVFLLMCYFLIVARFEAPESAIPVGLAREASTPSPETASPDPFALPAPTIRIVVRSLGEGSQACSLAADSPSLAPPASGAFTPAGLRAALGEALGATLDSEQRFIVAPASGARWEHAVAALDAVRLAGFSRVRFASPGERR